MDAQVTIAELRREQQRLLSLEHDLVSQVETVTACGEYHKLRDLADKLIEVAEKRARLRASLAEAIARERADHPPAERRITDQAAETWRLLR